MVRQTEQLQHDAGKKIKGLIEVEVESYYAAWSAAVEDIDQATALRDRGRLYSFRGCLIEEGKVSFVNAEDRDRSASRVDREE